MFAIGMKVYILFPLHENRRRTGILYDYLPGRMWPYHVRPDGWAENKSGIACTEEELAPIVQPTVTTEQNETV